RILADRKDAALAVELRQLVQSHADPVALQYLWGLDAVGGFSDDVALELLDHPNPVVRLWTIRLLGDRLSPNLWDKAAEKLARVAASEPDLKVRTQLACTAKRLSAERSMPILGNLLRRDEDVDDPRMPLLIWWAIESKADSDRDAVLRLFRDQSLWMRP